MHHVVLQSFFIIPQPKNLGANVVEQDGKSKKMAKKFQYSRLSKRMVKKNEG
jgi:hypothetical protein